MTNASTNPDNVAQLNACVGEATCSLEMPKSFDHFRSNGITIADWARAKNFNPRLVYAILRNERKCLRGESYKIAKELGMK
jgi:gp16 family phage-associated protein